MSITPLTAIGNSLSPLTDAFTNANLSGTMASQGAAALANANPASAIENGSPSRSFGQMLTDAIANVNDAQLKSADMTARFAAGQPMDIHQVMIASQEANVALNLALQVRNKLVDAYTEIMHVSV